MNATVSLTGIQLSASNLPLPDVSSWFAWYYERYLDFAAGASVESGDIVATTDTQEISATGEAQSLITGVSVDSEASEVNGLGSAETLVDGVQIESEAAEVTASESLNASVTLIGLELLASAASVTVSVLSPEIIKVSGGGGQYIKPQYTDAIAKITGISTKIVSGNVKAFGVVSISASANASGIGINSSVPAISAEGILSISDEELMLLLAA